MPLLCFWAVSITRGTGFNKPWSYRLHVLTNLPFVLLTVNLDELKSLRPGSVLWKNLYSLLWKYLTALICMTESEVTAPLYMGRQPPQPISKNRFYSEKRSYLTPPPFLFPSGPLISLSRSVTLLPPPCYPLRSHLSILLFNYLVVLFYFSVISSWLSAISRLLPPPPPSTRYLSTFCSWHLPPFFSFRYMLERAHWTTTSRLLRNLPLLMFAYKTQSHASECLTGKVTTDAVTSHRQISTWRRTDLNLGFWTSPSETVGIKRSDITEWCVANAFDVRKRLEMVNMYLCTDNHEITSKP